MQSNDQLENRKDQNHVTKLMTKERMQNHKVSVAAVPLLGANSEDHGKIDAKMIDLNARPYRTLGQASNSRVCLLCVSFFLFLDLQCGLHLFKARYCIYVTFCKHNTYLTPCHFIFS